MGTSALLRDTACPLASTEAVQQGATEELGSHRQWSPCGMSAFGPTVLAQLVSEGCSAGWYGSGRIILWEAVIKCCIRID